jgi:hypothetical protein
VFFYNPSTRTSVWERPPELYNHPDVDLLLGLSKPPPQSLQSLLFKLIEREHLHLKKQEAERKRVAKEERRKQERERIAEKNRREQLEAREEEERRRQLEQEEQHRRRQARRAVDAKLEEKDRRMAEMVLQQLQSENSVCLSICQHFIKISRIEFFLKIP